MPPKVKFTREEIVAAAFAIVRETGVDALTARLLSRKLGCSVCPIFTVFASMDEVRNAAERAAKDLYADYIRKGLEETPAFKGVGMQYIRFAKDEPQLFQLLFMSETGIGSVGEFLPAIDENYDKILDSVVSSYGLEESVAKRLYTHLTVYSHGIATLFARGVCDFSMDDVSRMLTEVFVALLKDVKGGAKQ